MALRRTYGSNCSHFLYDGGCKLSTAPFKVDATVLNINGDKLTAGAFATFPDTTSVPSGWWVTGFVERPSTGDMRFIIGHNSDEITLLSAFEDLEPGEVVYAHSGCDHAFTTCKNKFKNEINFGGFPCVPLKNPFEHKID